MKHLETLESSVVVKELKKRLELKTGDVVYRTEVYEDDVFKSASEGLETDNRIYVLCNQDIEEEHRLVNVFTRGDASKFIIKEPYSYILENGEENVSIYGVDYSSYTLYDANAETLQGALYFDDVSLYTLSERNYDLKQLYDLLKESPEVSFRKDDTSKEYVQGVETDFKSVLHSIPYYNSERGRSKTLVIKWVLPKGAKLKTKRGTFNYHVIFEECLARLGITDETFAEYRIKANKMYDTDED